MRFRLLLAFSLICTGLLTSCSKEDDPVAPYASVKIQVANEVSGQPVNMGPISYRNAAGNDYSISLLKYYLSNFTLIRKDKSELHLNKYFLINAADPASLSIALDSVVNGDYDYLRFNVGIDSARNHTGAQDGALDPVNGMIWTWNTGYIFFKHEGNFKDSAGVVQPLVYHLGTDMALSTVTVPIDLNMAGANKNFMLHFNLNKLYSSSGGNVNFNDGNVRMSSPRDDMFWMVTLQSNFKEAFTLSSDN